jgi:hypothetical protein
MTIASRRTRLLSLAGSAVLVTTAAFVGAAPAQADPGEVVAQGLDNPRQLSFSGDTMYVAEAGTGGSGPCMPGPEGGDVCFGTTGAVTMVTHSGQHRVLSGLPSLAAPDGSQAIGAADVQVTRGGRFALTIGLGADPAVRHKLPYAGKKRMGTILRGRFHHTKPWIAKDLAAFEARTDLDGLGPDSNPTGLLGSAGKYVVTDSGANTLLAVHKKRITPLAVFDSPGKATLPFPPFDEIDIQPVPTSVAVGPDGAYYVSELTGFPFLPGIARIHRVVPGQEPTVYATGLTNVTDLAWHGDDLYAVQIADEGLASAPEGELPMGSLVRVDPGGAHEMVAGPFPTPYGVAFHDDSAYVTTCAVCPDGGTVVKVPLD